MSEHLTTTNPPTAEIMKLLDISFRKWLGIEIEELMWKKYPENKPTTHLVAYVANEKGWMGGGDIRAVYHPEEEVWVHYNPQSREIILLDVTHYLEIPEFKFKEKNAKANKSKTKPRSVKASAKRGRQSKRPDHSKQRTKRSGSVPSSRSRASAGRNR